MKRLLLLFAVLFMLVQGSWAQLSGIKTIPGDYATIEAAVADLNVQGVGAGGVTFNVAAGHTENITAPILLTATGTVANPIVFQKSGAGDNPAITRTDAGSLTTTTQGGQGDAVFIIEGGDYITLTSLSIFASDAGIEYGVYLRKASGTDGCKNVTIQSCLIDMTKGTSQFVAGIYSSNNDAASTVSSATGITVTSEDGRHENVSVLGNTIRDVHVGVLLRGFNHTSSPYNFYDQNFVIGSSGQGNIIRNFGGGVAQSSYGIYMIYHNGINIGYNQLNNTAAGGTAFLGATSYGIFTSTATSANVTITNNSLTLTGGGTTQLMHGINNAAGSTGVGNTVNISNNTVTGCTYPTATSAAFTAIVNSASAVTINVNNNTVTNNDLPGTGTFTGIDGGGSTSPVATLTMTGNTVNNNTKSGASGSMFLTRGSASTVHYYSNTVYTNGFTASSGTTACSLYGYYNFGSPPTENVYNNQIYDLYVLGTNTGTSSLLSGIHTNTTASAVKNIYGNDIYNLSAQSGVVAGINQFLGTNVQIYKNDIYDLTNATTVTTDGRVNGILLNSGTCYVYNNFISELYAPACAAPNAIRGISSTSTTASTTIGLYYNTIYLDAVSTGVNFGTSGIFHTFSTTGTTASLDMRNNIVVNKSTAAGTGKTAALWRSAATNLNNYATTSNNNAFYAGTPSASNVLYYDGLNFDQTMVDFKTRVAPRESASFSEDVDFLNVAASPFDLKLDLTTATQCESGGQRITTPVAITTDYFATIRALETGYLGTGTAPDVGAYEGEMTGLDLSPPLIAYTALGNTASTAARNITVTVTDASGVPTVSPGWPNLYWRINAGGWTAATPTGVAGSDYTYSFGAGVVLGDVVEYYVVAQDNASTPNVGAFPSAGAGGFTTNPPAAATPPTTPSSYTIVAGIGGALTVGTGGDYPTLTGAGGLFADINTKSVTSSITVTVLSDLTEDGTNALNQWSEDAPGSFTVTIKPNTATTPVVSGTYAGGLIRLNGADRVTIDGSNSGGTDRSLTIQNNSAVANTAAIQIISLGSNAGATDNTIKNCNIKAGEIGSTTSLNTFGIYVGEAAISTTGTGADNDGLTIQNNAISKARYGIYARATGTTNANDNLLITGNEIGSADPLEYVTFRGIDLTYAQGPVVSQNTIFNLKTTLSASNAGMDFGSGVNDAVITRNNITGVYSESTSGYGAYGINFNSSTSVNNNLIANNTISDIRAVNYSTGSTTFNAFGIRLVGGTNTSLYYNSVSLTGNITIVSGAPSQPNSSPLVVTSTSVTGLNMVNNVFSNQQSFVSGTPKTYSVWFPTSYAGFGTVNYNDYYGTTSAPGTYYVGRVGSTDYATLLDWQGFTTQDANSIGADPQFVSETNLQPFTGSPVLAAGTPIVGITTDYTGASRSGTTPAIGAYESGQAAAAVGWANLQYPPNATITEGQTFTAYARVWQDGVTNFPGAGVGIESWFGWNAADTDPATWTNWISGTYNADYGNDDEWMADIGAGITPGTYYYASRFRTTGGTYQYGGYSGGFWNGTTNVSGVLTVNPITISVPHSEGFEAVTFPPAGWKRENVLGSEVWNRVTDQFRSGIASAKITYQSTSGEDWLITPQITGVVTGDILSFYWRNAYSSAFPPDQLDILVSTTNSNTASFTNVLGTINTANSPQAWTNHTFALDAYNGQNIYIAFKHTNTDGNGGFLDDVVLTKATTTWLGTSNTAWGTGANWSNGVPLATQNAIIDVSANNPVLSSPGSVNDLTINSGAILSVTNGGQLTVNGVLTNSAGNGGLVLQSNASGTGSLIHNTANVPATIQRYITGGQYHFASVPLTAAANPTAALFMNSYLWEYDPTIPDWVKYLNTTDALTVDQGYMIWYTGANTTYSFAGNMNNGAFTAATPGGAGTFNLVPNPYPSAIDWDAATGWTKTNVANATYIYNNTQYASYVAGVGANGGTNIIPVGQAFFVEATGAPVLAMNNSVRTHSSQAYFNEPVISDLFRIAVSANGTSDETVVRFTESATASFDSEYDAAKLYGNASAPQLYTLAADNQMLSINSLSMTEGGVSVPLSFEFSANGDITLQFSGVGSFSEQQAIFIEDQLTGSMTDLRQHGSYSFNHLVTNDPDRFLLHFRDITGVDEQGNGWMIFANDRKVYVNIPELNGQRAGIEMFDVPGSRIFSSEGVMNSPAVVRAANSGVAIVRVTAQGRVYTTKLFIQ